jgi:hypothetical protein
VAGSDGPGVAAPGTTSGGSDGGWAAAGTDRSPGDAVGGNGAIFETQGGERKAIVTGGDPARAVMDALAGRFTPEVLCAKLEDLMGFEKTYMNRNGDTISSPDGTVQLKAVETIIAYLVGRPIERQQVMTVAQPATMNDLLDKARKSPVFRSTLRQLLDGLEASV